ncbi:MAG TPA: hypothetical protein VFC00_04230 [Micromonosporaceae bacterium]|nr:hypothetical protein [Micromonosporaceae bacterium]
MAVEVDQAALAGAAVAGVIAISSAEGRYEPFETVTGVVLAILLAAYYRPSTPEKGRDEAVKALTPSAVVALVASLVASSVVDWATMSGRLHVFGRNSLGTSWALSLFWLIAFVGAYIALRYHWGAKRRRSRSPTQ